MRCTCVFFHAHPDDEALLTAGTMARLADEGHRVVLVVATAGERGLAAGIAAGPRLAQVRRAELEVSAQVLGCARVAFLGYADSGHDPVPAGGDDGPVAFADADVEEAARRLAAILREEDATLLTVYDPVGGYGHPDHVQVHRVGTRAAELAGTPLVLEATVDRRLLWRALRLAAWARRLPTDFDAERLRHAYSASAEITHRVDVRRYAAAKRASMRAHASQATGGERTLAALLRIPPPLFRQVLGTEWYVQRGLRPGAALRHPLAGLAAATRR